MDPDNPVSRVERTFWVVWNYITGAVNRLLRPELTVNNEQVTGDGGHPQDESDVIEEQLVNPSAPLRPTVAWELCTTDIDLGAEEERVQQRSQLSGGTNCEQIGQMRSEDAGQNREAENTHEEHEVQGSQHLTEEKMTETMAEDEMASTMTKEKIHVETGDAEMTLQSVADLRSAEEHSICTEDAAIQSIVTDPEEDNRNDVSKLYLGKAPTSHSDELHMTNRESADVSADAGHNVAADGKESDEKDEEETQAATAVDDHQTVKEAKEEIHVDEQDLEKRDADMMLQSVTDLGSAEKHSTFIEDTPTQSNETDSEEETRNDVSNLDFGEGLTSHSDVLCITNRECANVMADTGHEHVTVDGKESDEEETTKATTVDELQKLNVAREETHEDEEDLERREYDMMLPVSDLGSAEEHSTYREDPVIKSNATDPEKERIDVSKLDLEKGPTSLYDEFYMTNRESHRDVSADTGHKCVMADGKESDEEDEEETQKATTVDDQQKAKEAKEKIHVDEQGLETTDVEMTVRSMSELGSAEEHSTHIEEATTRSNVTDSEEEARNDVSHLDFGKGRTSHSDVLRITSRECADVTADTGHKHVTADGKESDEEETTKAMTLDDQQKKEEIHGDEKDLETRDPDMMLPVSDLGSAEEHSTYREDAVMQSNATDPEEERIDVSKLGLEKGPTSLYDEFYMTNRESRRDVSADTGHKCVMADGKESDEEDEEETQEDTTVDDQQKAKEAKEEIHVDEQGLETTDVEMTELGLAEEHSTHIEEATTQSNVTDSEEETRNDVSHLDFGNCLTSHSDVLRITSRECADVTADTGHEHVTADGKESEEEEATRAMTADDQQKVEIAKEEIYVGEKDLQTRGADMMLWSVTDHRSHVEDAEIQSNVSDTEGKNEDDVSKLDLERAPTLHSCELHVSNTETVMCGDVSGDVKESDEEEEETRAKVNEASIKIKATKEFLHTDDPDLRTEDADVTLRLMTDLRSAQECNVHTEEVQGQVKEVVSEGNKYNEEPMEQDLGLTSLSMNTGHEAETVEDQNQNVSETPIKETEDIPHSAGKVLEAEVVDVMTPCPAEEFTAHSEEARMQKDRTDAAEVPLESDTNNEDLDTNVKNQHPVYKELSESDVCDSLRDELRMADEEVNGHRHTPAGKNEESKIATEAVHNQAIDRKHEQKEDAMPSPEPAKCNEDVQGAELHLSEDKVKAAVEKKYHVTADISVEEKLFDDANQEDNKESCVGNLCRTTVDTLKPKCETGQEIRGESKNTPKGIYGQELNSPTSEETKEALPEYNNELELDENTTQTFLEGGDYMEFSVSPLPEEVEKEQLESLGHFSYGGDFTVVRSPEVDQSGTLQLKDPEPVQGSKHLPEGEDTSLLDISKKMGTKTSEEDWKSDATATNLGDANEGMLVDFAIDEGVCETQNADGDSREAFGAVTVVDDILNAFGDGEATMTQPIFPQASVDVSISVPDSSFEDMTECRAVKKSDDPVETQHEETDVEETGHRATETHSYSCRQDALLETINPSLDKDPEKSLTDTEAVSDLSTATCSEAMSVAEIAENEAEEEQGHAGLSESEDVIDEEILDLWIEEVSFKETEQQETGQHVEPNEEEMSSIRTEEENRNLFRTISRECDTEMSLSGVCESSTVLFHSPNETQATESHLTEFQETNTRQSNETEGETTAEIKYPELVIGLSEAKYLSQEAQEKRCEKEDVLSSVQAEDKSEKVQLLGESGLVEDTEMSLISADFEWGTETGDLPYTGSVQIPNSTIAELLTQQRSFGFQEAAETKPSDMTEEETATQMGFDADSRPGNLNLGVKSGECAYVLPSEMNECSLSPTAKSVLLQQPVSKPYAEQINVLLNDSSSNGSFQSSTNTLSTEPITRNFERQEAVDTKQFDVTEEETVAKTVYDPDTVLRSSEDEYPDEEPGEPGENTDEEQDDSADSDLGSEGEMNGEETEMLFRSAREDASTESQDEISSKHETLLMTTTWSQDPDASAPEFIRPDVSAEPARYFGLQTEVDATTLDFTVQRSRIAVKNPRVRKPKDPRSLLHKPSLDPTPSTPPSVGRPGAVPLRGIGMGIKLPGIGGGIPVLKKTQPVVTEKSSEVMLLSKARLPTVDEHMIQMLDHQQELEAKAEETSEIPKPNEAPHRPKWMPPTRQGFGNPLMSELKTKLKKTTEE